MEVNQYCLCQCLLPQFFKHIQYVRNPSFYLRVHHTYTVLYCLCIGNGQKICHPKVAKIIKNRPKVLAALVLPVRGGVFYLKRVLTMSDYSTEHVESLLQQTLQPNTDVVRNAVSNLNKLLGNSRSIPPLVQLLQGHPLAEV